MWLFRRKNNVYIVQEDDHQAVLGVFSTAHEAIYCASYAELTSCMNVSCVITEWEVGGRKSEKTSTSSELQRRLAVRELPEEYQAKVADHERERRVLDEERAVAMSTLADAVRERYNELLDRYDKVMERCDAAKGAATAAFMRDRTTEMASERVREIYRVNDALSAAAQASLYAHGEKLLEDSPQNQDGYGFELDDLWSAELLQELLKRTAD